MALLLCLSAPQMFTKVLVSVLALLHSRGIPVLGYLEDITLQEQLFEFWGTVYLSQL